MGEIPRLRIETWGTRRLLSVDGKQILRFDRMTNLGYQDDKL